MGQPEGEEPRKGRQRSGHPEEKDIEYEKIVEEQKNVQAVRREHLLKLRRHLKARDEIDRIQEDTKRLEEIRFRNKGGIMTKKG